MIHEILPVGILQCNCSIFGDEQSREAIVVDPGDDIAKITALLDRHGLTVKAIVITHAHIDHIGGAAQLKALTGAPGASFSSSRRNSVSSTLTSRVGAGSSMSRSFRHIFKRYLSSL